MTTQRLYSGTAMALAFDMAICTRDDVATWVVARVEELDVLPDALLDLTTLRRKDDTEITRLLGELGPRLSSEETTRLAIDVLADAAGMGKMTCARAFSYLWSFATSDALLWDDKVEVYQIGDIYDWGRVEEADARVRAFLGARRSSWGTRHE